MTQGLAFLLSMVIEGVVAALFGGVLSRRFNLSRFSASVRTGAAAVIGTGATLPAILLGFQQLMEWTGTWRGAAALGGAGVILVEMLFYAAVLRGHWRWAFGLALIVNLISFGAGYALLSLVPNSNQ